MGRFGDPFLTAGQFLPQFFRDDGRVPLAYATAVRAVRAATAR